MLYLEKKPIQVTGMEVRDMEVTGMVSTDMKKDQRNHGSNIY